MKAVYRGVLANVTGWCANPGETEPDEAFRAMGATAEEMAALDLPGGRIGLDVTADLWDSDGVILDHELWVSWMDPGLVVDPTDTQVDAARAGRPIAADPELLRQAVEWARENSAGVAMTARILRDRTRPATADVTTRGRQGDAR